VKELREFLKVTARWSRSERRVTQKAAATEDLVEEP